MGVDKRIRTNSKEVAGVLLNYTVENNYGSPVEQVRIDLLQNESRIGGITIERNGKLYISFDKSDVLTSYNDQEAVITTALSDAHKYFNDETIE